MPAYDTQNPFAKILRGEFPCHKVYEDEHVLAFLDIMPRSPGHTPVLSVLGRGSLRVTVEGSGGGSALSWVVEGGFLSVDDDQVTVVVDGVDDSATTPAA